MTRWERLADKASLSLYTIGCLHASLYGFALLVVMITAKG